MYQFLKSVINCPSVSGREGAVADVIESLITPYVDECYRDALGNLIACKRGNGENRETYMLCAHMDEIGFIATFIEDNGYIRSANVGGIHYVASAYSEVVFENGVRGVLVPDASAKASEYTFDKFVVDIGAKNKKEAMKKVKIGDCFVVKPSLIRLMGKRVAGRPFDDRIGCAILLDIARHFAGQGTKDDLYYVFSTQEEVGCRGAKTAGFAIAPDYAIVFDVTGTGDATGAKPMAVSLGDGAAIKIKDSSVFCHAETVAKLHEIAKREGIPHQTEILTYGGTDTSSIQMAGTGCRACALSIPSRYIHSGVEVVDMGDARACADLAIAFIKEEK